YAANEAICELEYDDNLEHQENSIYTDLVPLDGRAPQAQNDWTNINLIMDQEDLRRYPAGGPQYGGGVWKYVGKDGVSSIGRSFSERDANWIFYRYAEVMLMKAEACIELDRFNEANDLISETMLRAGAPFVEQTDKDLMREMLLNERGREFLFEGRRWFDMLRAAKRNDFEDKQLIIDMILSGADIKQQAILRTRVYDTLSYYLPVPERELIYNQNLVQNPFYDR
ncbi:MAG: RagB/SusD family nutrient uptake outer membrane protein, partial [Bacteroides sp.]|nr:RagB/SusD family nutrient uptake outer membrane protein [Bacteroides sp.]